VNAHFILTVSLGCLVYATIAGETNYHSPIDGQSYRADWHTYYPSNSPATNSAATNAPVSRVQNQGIRLLSTQDEFSRGIDVTELAGFIRKTGEAIDRSLEVTNDSFELLVQTQLSKDTRPSFKIASQGNISQAMLQRIYDAFGRLPDYRSRDGELRYEVRFTIAKKP
jgi:hypothetical protein